MKIYRKLIRPVHCYPGQGYETKTELVEKEEKWYPEEEREHLEGKYGYLNEGHFSDLIFEEKYEPCLQELKKVIGIADFIEGIEVGYCPSCDKAIVNKKIDETKFCKFCGQAVKWND